ncbi:MAG: hypothetical protein HC890_04960 [Chloroflexaceae bacterium]|nr:hypothetical protein [Chloroflexaceae bacterium]
MANDHFPPDFPSNGQVNKAQTNGRVKAQPDLEPPLSQVPSPQTQRFFQRLYLVLLLIGLGLGAIVATGVVLVLQRAGLTDNPPPRPTQSDSP